MEATVLAAVAVEANDDTVLVAQTPILHVLLDTTPEKALYTDKYHACARWKRPCAQTDIMPCMRKHMYRHWLP